MAFDKILVIDDEVVIRRGVADHFRSRKYGVKEAKSIEEAKAILERDSFDFIFLDEMLPDGRGSEFLKHLKATLKPFPFIVMISGHGSVEEAIKCIHSGAFDFVLKPFSLGQVEIALKRAETFDQLQKVTAFFNSELNSSSELIGSSPPMLSLKKIIQKVAPTAATVLVTGENGTGKEVISREIYRLSRLSDSPFITVNCAAISETLIESEFFGHEKGAFTGAAERRTGRFELANGGTILLDEIGEISPKVQAKLLRVLQEKEFERVGGTKTIKVNVRVIATTNRDLADAVQRGEFREDLFYRLSVFPLKVPPLRDRGNDILQLAENFLKRFSAKHHLKGLCFSNEAQAALLLHSWPGNVRELGNAIERAVILAEDNEALGPNLFNLTQPNRLEHPPIRESKDVPPIRNASAFTNPTTTTSESTHPDVSAKTTAPDLSTSLTDMERDHILKLLEENNGNRTATAKTLNITTRTLRNKINQYRSQGYQVP